MLLLNAALEGVADSVELQTADMRTLPFEDGSFDVVVSSLAIHNVPGDRERAKAVRDAARVLKKGGRLMVVDIRHARDYARELKACGLTITAQRSLQEPTRAVHGDRIATVIDPFGNQWTDAGR
jgi:ubiquinone/menaquinone biosynthesis C-methylase UbiE